MNTHFFCILLWKQIKSTYIYKNITVTTFLNIFLENQTIMLTTHKK